MKWLDGNHRFDGHEFEQALGVGDGQGSLMCCSPWGCTESDMTEATKQERALFSSVAQSCPTLRDPMDHSMPGLPVHHQLPEFTQTHVHQVGKGSKI